MEKLTKEERYKKAIFSLREQLRRAREDQHLDIYQVAEITKIKTDHIRALLTNQKINFCIGIKEDIEKYIHAFFDPRAEKIDEGLLNDLDTLIPDVNFEEEEDSIEIGDSEEEIQEVVVAPPEESDDLFAAPPKEWAITVST